MSIPSDTSTRVGDDLAKATDTTRRGAKAAVDQMTTASKAALNTGLDAADAGAEAAKASVETAQSLARTAADRAGEGVQVWSAGAAEAVERSGQGLQAMTDMGLSAAGRLRDISIEWVAVAQQGAERSLERIQALTGARSPEAFIAAHRSLVWGGLEDLAQAQQRLARATLRLWEDNVDRLGAVPREASVAAA